MRIKKPIVILLAVMIAVLAIVGALLFKVGLTTPQVTKKVFYMISAVLIVVLIGLLGYLLFLGRDKEHNYFLYDKKLGKNIPLEDLRFSIVNERMDAYIVANFESSDRLWSGSTWTTGTGFGSNGEYRGLIAYKMLYDLAERDKPDQWARFANAPSETVSRLCDALSRSGEKNLAQKLMYIRQNCGHEIAPLRSLLLGNKKYLASKMTGLVRRNIEWFYNT